MRASQETYYVKSLEEDMFTKICVAGEKQNLQSISDIIHTKVILPNTLSFNLPRRLCCTVLHKNYLKSYRPQGLIFKTVEKPALLFPFDLMIMTNNQNMTARYDDMQICTAEHYRSALLNGYECFSFDSFEELISLVPNPNAVWEKVVQFRKMSGAKDLDVDLFRFCEYNEAIFFKAITIEPVAIFGDCDKAKEIAKEFNLLHCSSAQQFYLQTLVSNINTL